jgi:hypothetical protein
MAGAGRRTFVPGEVLTASNVNSYLMDQAVMVFDDATERDTALGTAVVSQGMVTYLKDDDVLEAYDGTDWRNVSIDSVGSYRFVETLYFTSSGTFTKADYPWLRAIKVKVQAGGSGGAGRAASNNSGAGGAGGGYAERFFSDIASLSSSVTVTVGAGGAGGAAGNNNGAVGGVSSFGNVGDAWRTRATGGEIGTSTAEGGGGGVGTHGSLLIAGQAGGRGQNGSPESPGVGGSSHLGGGGRVAGASAGFSGGIYGGGGGGASVTGSNLAGGNGAPGIVIVELYA